MAKVVFITEEGFLEIECYGSSDIQVKESPEGLRFSFDYGACKSEFLTNEDIDTIIDFLNSHRPQTKTNLGGE